jgi:hypothetical protein
MIISDFPENFDEFCRKWFSILWRSGSNGFGVLNFDRCCDGHVNTLTLIESTNGNIFGGFALVEWTWKSVMESKEGTVMKNLYNFRSSFCGHDPLREFFYCGTVVFELCEFEEFDMIGGW